MEHFLFEQKMLRKQISDLLLLYKNLSRVKSFDNTRNQSTLSNSNLRKPISTNCNTTKTSKFLVLCNSQITKNGRNGNLEEAESIFKRMPIKNVISWTAMLTAYADNGETIKARKMFDEMPQRNIATWNAMITAYIRNNHLISEAAKLFSRMPERNVVSHAAMITGFVHAGMMSEAVKVYSEMPKIGRDPVVSNALISGYLKRGELEEAVQVFEGMVKRDVVSWSSILDGYWKKGRITEAIQFFEKMPERNVVSWTTMIGGYLKMGQWEDGFKMSLQMRRDGHIKVNSTTLTVILQACGDMDRFREGIQVHGLVLLMGFEFDVFLGNSIINMYCRAGWMSAAKNIFDMMDKKDIVSWNSLIAGFVQNGGIEEAYTCFKKMPHRDVVSWTTMIAGFSGQGRIEESISLFKEMPKKDDVAWTAVISGFVANEKYEEALWWFILMAREAIKPNAVTLSSVLGASSGLATLNQGMQVHANVVKMDMTSELSIQNSLISMYAKCGNVGDAYRIFTSIHAPNIVSINSIITGFAQHGFGKEALELFKKMQMKGLEPNQITFLGVLSACVHMGLVEEGWDYFKTMGSIYHIEPGPDHYACMVDLLGRSGMLREALSLINSMPMNPHPGVWGALLSASRTHMDVAIAKLAARHLFLLEPENATAYVVLSNVYSSVGLKKDEEELRMTKKTKGVKKNPGCSWIIVNNKVNLFVVSDQSHKEFGEVNAMLRRISNEMRELGFQSNI